MCEGNARSDAGIRFYRVHNFACAHFLFHYAFLPQVSLCESGICWTRFSHSFSPDTTEGATVELILFTTKAPPKVEPIKFQTSSTTRRPQDLDAPPANMTLEQCSIETVDVSRTLSAYDLSVSLFP